MYSFDDVMWMTYFAFTMATRLPVRSSALGSIRYPLWTYEQPSTSSGLGGGRTSHLVRSLFTEDSLSDFFHCLLYYFSILPSFHSFCQTLCMSRVRKHPSMSTKMITTPRKMRKVGRRPWKEYFPKKLWHVSGIFSNKFDGFRNQY